MTLKITEEAANNSKPQDKAEATEPTPEAPTPPAEPTPPPAPANTPEAQTENAEETPSAQEEGGTTQSVCSTTVEPPVMATFLQRPCFFCPARQSMTYFNLSTTAKHMPTEKITS